MNAITIIGRAGRDPELRYFESGKCKAHFSVAVDRPTKEKQTDWFDVELWGKQAEVAAEYVRKGDQVGIEGAMQFDKYTDDKGQQRQKAYINGSRLHLLGSKARQEAQPDETDIIFAN